MRAEQSHPGASERTPFVLEASGATGRLFELGELLDEGSWSLLESSEPLAAAVTVERSLATLFEGVDPGSSEDPEVLARRVLDNLAAGTRARVALSPLPDDPAARR